ncbi:hypothetical protein BGX28_004247 [Mortierella sp. GBA30]|nr:hypothetical protein BGX28_004247 [Mortierella sp. GBA30]
MVLPYAKLFSRDNTQELSASLTKPSSYKILYWPICAVGSTSRDLLEYGGAQWESLVASGRTWPEEKLDTPFHCLPVLYVKTEDGKDLVLSEASVVEQYLAKQFVLLGENDYEENLVKIFQSSSSAVQNQFAVTVTWNQSEAKGKCFDFFKDNTLTTWVQTHEKHLVDNGNNGHYVGNKLTLADIRTANVIDHFSAVPEAEKIMAVIKKSEALMKVHDKVLRDPKIAAWRASEKYQELYKGSQAFFANPFAFMGSN